MGVEYRGGKHENQAVAVALAAHWLMSQPFWGARTVTNSAALANAPRVRRDRRTLPVGAARGQASREQQAGQRLAQMVRGR